MFVSRLHFDYDNMHVSLDTYSGDLLELYNRKAGKLSYENMIKSSAEWIERPNHHHPFTITAKFGEKERTFRTIKSLQSYENKEYRAQISSKETENGLLITVKCPYIADEEGAIPVNLHYTLLLKGDTVKFNLYYQNDFADLITEVRFPIIDGIWIGDDWTDNELVYPYHAGKKITDPINTLFTKPKLISWRWLEYRYFYRHDAGCDNARLAKYGLNGLSDRYPGGLSMSFVDLYNKDGGFYFGVHDPDYQPVYLEVGSFGERFLGLVFASAFEPRTQKGNEYKTPDTVIYIHQGDWHEASRFYRDFRKPLIPTVKKVKPEWMNDSVGFFTHYDFKNQQGEITHTYKDLPRLADEALEAGFKHILLSGWHKDGFDRGYPMYMFDPDLGTEQEFIDGVKACNDKGVHVTVYMNIKMHSVKYDTENLDEKCVYNQEGKPVALYFGNANIEFRHMCPKSKGWPAKIMECYRRVVEEYGIDGIYFDQLNCGNFACFNPKHDHKFNDIQSGYVDIVKNLRADYESKNDDTLFISGEWVIDRMGGVVTYQLNQSFFDIKSGAFPELYRYTFPEHGITDMLYPSKNLAMRPVHVAMKSQELMAMLFTNGSYFWVYDYVEDNTFTKDPEGYALLKDLIKLRKIQQKEFGKYLFADNDGICFTGEGTRVTRFIDGENSILAVFKQEKEADAQVKLDFHAKNATAILPDGSTKKLKIKNGVLKLSNDKACIICLK